VAPAEGYFEQEESLPYPSNRKEGNLVNSCRKKEFAGA